MTATTSGLPPKIPLLVVDVQVGFIPEEEEAQRALQQICGLVRGWTLGPVIVLKFVNDANSTFRTDLDWNEMGEGDPGTEHPDCMKEVLANIPEGQVLRFEKSVYSAFAHVPFVREVQKEAYQEMYICGFDTDACVAHSAVGAFDHKVRPLVVEDAVYSSHGGKVHAEAIESLRRLLGDRRVLKVEDIAG